MTVLPLHLSLGCGVKLQQFSPSSCEDGGILCLRVRSAALLLESDWMWCDGACFLVLITSSVVFVSQWPTKMESSGLSWPRWRSLDRRGTTSCNWLPILRRRFDQSERRWLEPLSVSASLAVKDGFKGVCLSVITKNWDVGWYCHGFLPFNNLVYFYSGFICCSGQRGGKKNI